MLELTDSTLSAARAFNKRLEEALARETTVADHSTAGARARDMAELCARVDHATDETLSGPGGPLRLRRFAVPDARATCLYLHPGGWVLGGPDVQDLRLDRLARATRTNVVALGYRLAPEHPHPAAVGDIVCAARHLAGEGLVLMGESAGAHLGALALLELRGASPVLAALLGHGTYDLADPLEMGPETAPFPLDPRGAAWFLERYLPPGVDPRRPDVSPVFADCAGLPPALLTVGARDVVVEHTRRLHAAWPGSELDVYPEGVHCFDRMLGHPLAPIALERQCAFLDRVL